MTRRPISRKGPRTPSMPAGPVLWYGRETPLPPVRTLASGPLDFDLDGVDLARVRWGPTELVNRVYMSVRDRNWDTVLPTISDLHVVTVPDSVTITFAARNQAADIDLEWRGTIIATADGRITYDMRGRALGAFEYCRIGFCVLYAEMAASGRPYRAETPEGVVAGNLPTLIAPQEIVDGRELPLIPPCSSLELELDGVAVRAGFEGSLFSSEDQRNWTDASFKTCCVAGTAYPYPARRGQVFAQRVTLAATGRPVVRAPRATRIERLEIGETMGFAWPAIGLGIAAEPARDLAPRAASRLASLRLDHLRLDLHLSSPDWFATLARGVRAAKAVGARLEIALFLDTPDIEQLAGLAAAIVDVPVARFIVLPEWTPTTRTTAPGLIDLVRSTLEPTLGRVTLIGGTDGDFAELNRDRPSTTRWDGVSYSINPQVHAFDNRSLVETLATQATTVETARSFSGSTPVVVSPVTLRQRFNPSAIGEAAVDDTDLPSSVDPRQMSLFGAGWTLGSIASLVRAGVASLTYFETVGWRGVMETARPGEPAAGFPSRPGMVYPMFHVFADLADRDAMEPVAVSHGAPDGLTSIAMRRGHRIRALIANLTASRSTIAIGPWRGQAGRMRVLDDATAPFALMTPSGFRRSTDPIVVRNGQVRCTLGPFAYLWLEGIADTPERRSRPG